MTRPGDAERRDAIPKDLAADFDQDDEALWGVLGVLADESPSATSPEFVRETLAKARREPHVIPSGWSIYRRPLAWIGTGLAAAGLVAAVTLWPFGADVDDTTPSKGSAVAEDTDAPGADIDELRDVVKQLNAIDESAWLGLDVASAEADDVAWFGN